MRRTRRGYSRKPFSSGKFTLAPFIFLLGLLVYILIGVLNVLNKALYKISLWGIKEWIICFFIVGGLIALYIIADRHSKQRYFTEIPVRAFQPKKGRSIFEITEGFTPREFEIFVGDLYRLSGYHSEVTTYSNDYGKDVILTKNKEITYVECKKYAEDNDIGRPYIQKLYGAMTKDNVKRGIFVTTSKFKNTAIKYANGTGIELVNGDDLIELIAEVRPELLSE
jgi:restriction system protein